MRIQFGMWLRFIPVLIVASFYYVVERIGIIKVSGEISLLGKAPIIVVGNHPSLFEATSLAFLRPFFKRYVLRPRLIPYSTPAAENIWRLFWPWQLLFGWTFIPMYRKGERGKNVLAVRKISAVLQKNGCVILFPEGTRTKNTPTETRVYLGEHQMGKISDTTHELLKRLANRNGAWFVPVHSAVSSSVVSDVFRIRWPIATFVIGNPILVNQLSERIENIILSTQET